MPNHKSSGEILLANNFSASTLLHNLLLDAAAAFPSALSEVALPINIKSFRKTYPEILPSFEAARLASSQRYEIANHIMDALQQHIVWQDNSGTRPLHQTLRETVPALPLETHSFSGTPGWQPNLVYRGERWEATRLGELGDLLVTRNVVSKAAGEALSWVSEQGLEAGLLNLSGRKIAVMGAGAEMAPTRLWLEAGADVLWLDTQPPPSQWWDSKDLSGRLSWPTENVDLLSNPQAVLATLIDFAEGSPLDLGLYAYAPGKAREMRLTASMNAIVDALPQDLIASVTLLVSPTTPTALSAQDLAAVESRLAARPLWEALCANLGLLGRGRGYTAATDANATRTVVAIQGASYQAAQYLGKILIAECWAHTGQLASPNSTPLRISANTAAITRTRSLAHPVFTAAFGGATAFGVETMAPRQSRRLNGLLASHDWLHPKAPHPGAIRVHGGIHTLPYPLGSALRVAAAIGFARSPQLLRGLVSK